jgi:apolipoprotein N-acyltransferase
LSVEWVRRIFPSAWAAWLFLATFLALYWPVFLWLARIGVNRFRVPLVVAAPIVWVALEYTRAYFLGGFPWYFAGHTQAEWLQLAQFIDTTGVWGLSLLVVAVNAFVVDLVTKPALKRTPRGPRVTWYLARRVLVLGLWIVAALVYGGIRLGQSDSFRTGPKLALIQTNFPQGKPERPTVDQLFASYRQLLDEALREKPDAIIWPETSYPFGLITIDPRLGPNELEKEAKAIDPESTAADWLQGRGEVQRQLQDWTNYAGIPSVFGQVSYHFLAGGSHKYNSAVLVHPIEGEPATVHENPSWPIYHKMHLVPFGEYIPFLKFLPFLAALSPYQGGTLPSLSPGPGPVRFDLAGAVAAPIICFEDTIPHVVRRYWTDGGQQPELLLNLTNDGWYEDSAEHEVHLLVAALRSIELRTPMVRAVNTGISAVIDGNGHITARLPIVTPGALVAMTPLDDRQSLYSQWGDWLPLTCFAIVIGWVPLSWTRIGRPAVQLESKTPPLPFLPKRPR